MARRWRRSPSRGGHDHAYHPSPVGGYHPDGSARVWLCDCGARIAFKPWPPVTVRWAR